jgi:hypothetical protein
MSLTMRELNGFGSLGENSTQATERKARPAIDRYVACLKQNGLAKAFYLQDPRQEHVTGAHRAGDPCYQALTPAIYIAVKEEVKGAFGETISDQDVQALFTAQRARSAYTLGNARLSAEDVGHLVEGAIADVEAMAQEQASARVGLVHAQEVSPSPLEVGHEEAARRIRAHQQQLDSGSGGRVITQRDIVTPEQQRVIRRRVQAEADAAARARGPLVSCPRGVPIEVCLEDHRRRNEPPFPWLAAGVLGIFGLALVAGLVGGSRRERSVQPAV